MHFLGLELRNQVAVEVLVKYAHNVLEIYIRVKIFTL
jgi:hypothetical protein